MRKIINLILLLLINITTLAQGNAKDVVEVKTDIYEVLYNVKYQQPILVKYEIFCKPDSPTYERDGISFKAYPGLAGSSSSDYKDNVYDKGHMAPANTFACTEKWLKETFSYVNCALQHQGLNRGTWAALERFERNLAGVYQGITVHIEIYFSDKWTTNSDPARIPSNFVKVITWNQNGKEKSISFDFPNEDTTGKSFWQFQIK
jgi:DNA/RNA endonuclease G (NUC1)